MKVKSVKGWAVCSNSRILVYSIRNLRKTCISDYEDRRGLKWKDLIDINKYLHARKVIISVIE